MPAWGEPRRRRPALCAPMSTLVTSCHAGLPAGDGAVTSCHAALPAGDGAPEWVPLVPAGTFRGVDGRGPYVLDDPDAVIAASGADPKVMCENHATDLAVTTGCAAPARGWIVEMQARDGALWGRMDWTGEGRRLVAAREYRGISPVFSHDKATGRVLRVLRATLTNVPNLDLPTLHSQQGHGMDLLTRLRLALGLADTADETAALASVAALRTAEAAHAQQLRDIAAAAKLDPSVTATGIVTALQAQGAKGGGTLEEMVALQSQVSQLRQERARDVAAAVIDKAIRDSKPIPPGKRDEFIARHMADPTGTEKWLADMPSLGVGGLGGRTAPAAAADGLDDADRQVIVLMGIDPAHYLKTKANMAVATGAA